MKDLLDNEVVEMMLQVPLDLLQFVSGRLPVFWHFGSGEDDVVDVPHDVTPGPVHHF